MALYQRVRKSISPPTARQLWILSGGRCQYRGCNCELWVDSLSMKNINKAYISHIIAASPNGPRGNESESKKLEIDIENLMLLCDECHNRIDESDVDSHSIELLRKMKTLHQERIRRVTGIHESQRSSVISYLCKIGDFYPILTKSKAFNTIMPEYFPAFDYILEGGTKNTFIEDHQEDYWKNESSALELWFGRNVTPLIDTKECTHISVFALAPQPLLIKLGTLIPDLIPTRVYQYFRNPSDSWIWENNESGIGARLISPENTTGIPVLIISLSALVNPNRITSLFLNQELSIWEVTVDSPARDCIRTLKQLEEIKSVFRKAFDEIKVSYSDNNSIHVFPVMPNSAAVEFGRVRMQKADLPMVIYDQNNKHKSFIPAITIN